MKLIDKVIKEHMEDVKEIFIKSKCPSGYGLEDSMFCGHGCNCVECWNQEYKGVGEG